MTPFTGDNFKGWFLLIFIFLNTNSPAGMSPFLSAVTVPMSSPSSNFELGELMAIASPQGKGLHPAAKFSQSDNSYTVNIDNIKILSVDIYNGTIGESTGIFVIKTYPASPAYMFQEAIGMYPIVRFWRPKVDGTWRGWREV